MYLDFTTNLGLSSLLATVLSVLTPNKQASVVHQPVLPPSYPLAVRSPYLSTWVPSNQVGRLPEAEPQFWTGQNLTWSIMARVDGQAYSLMNVKGSDKFIRPATVRSAEYTATHSLFTLTAGTVTITLDFFSPISPSDYLRQSLPFSYLTVSISGASSNNVQIYSSIDKSWTGKSESTSCSFLYANSTAMYSLRSENAIPYSEESDMATWGEAVLASQSTLNSSLSYASGERKDVQSQFAKTGKLNNANQFLTTGGIVGIAHDLGFLVNAQSVTFAVGHVREESINYLGRPYTGYYRALYPRTEQAVAHFLNDYPDALRESHALDLEMAKQAAAVAGQKYADIVTLSSRQAYAGIEITIPNDTLNTTDVLAFIKELSSDGNINTVDVIMPAFPIYYILDPNYIRLLLEPMMRYLAAGRWRQPYVIHDMGSHYPNAVGHDSQQAEPMPIEECGNLLVLVLAYVRATGDTDWASQYTELLQGYADYLVDNGINIAEQLSSNDAAGPLANETNLAIKAAVGIKAFGELTGFSEYSRVGDERAELLFSRGLGVDAQKTHFALQYPGKPASWKIPYNLYPDVLLDLRTFPKAAYDMGNTFFESVRAEYGVPLDDRQDWAKSDWNMWLAGTLDSTTRDEFVDDLWKYMTNGKHHWPFSDRYIATSAKGGRSGVPVLCRARPTVGGHFALLALQGPRCLQQAVYRRLGVVEEESEYDEMSLSSEL